MAVVVALCSLLIFGVAALAVDMGQAYQRRRASQTDADLAALAGVVELPGSPALARAKAIDYLMRNLPPTDEIATLPSGWDNDNNLDNGEIDIIGDTRIEVTVPRRRVQFGFAGAIGISRARVSAFAAAEIKSPAKLLPFYLNSSQANGYSCLKDTSPGNANSPVRDAWRATAPPDRYSHAVITMGPNEGPTGTVITITGSGFSNGDKVRFYTGATTMTVNTSGSGGQITATVPNSLTAGVTYQVFVEHANQSSPQPAGDFTVTAPSPSPSPSPTPSPTPSDTRATHLDPATGSLGDTTASFLIVLDSGTTFPLDAKVELNGAPATAVVAPDGQSITVTEPDTAGSYSVIVTDAAGAPIEDAGVFELAAAQVIDPCAGTTGSFGFLNIPRKDATQNELELNIVKGMDHGARIFPAADLPAVNEECDTEDDPLDLPTNLDKESPQDPIEDGVTCLDMQNGNKMSAVSQALISGFGGTPQTPGRLTTLHDGAETATLLGETIDDDELNDFLPVGTTPADVAAGSAVGAVDMDIVNCKRFFFVPVLNTDENPPNGFYPIVTFRGVFIEDFVLNNNATQIEAIKAWTFPLSALPSTLASGGDVTEYIGAGPKVPVLVE